MFCTIGASPMALKLISARDGSTADIHIKLASSTRIDNKIPRKINCPRSSHPPPIKVKNKRVIDIQAERIQKKQKALILNTINHIKRRLKIAMLQEIANKPHQVFRDKSVLFSDSPGKSGIIAMIRIAR